MKLPGVISLRKDLPIWPMPNGGFLRVDLHDVGEVDEDALRGLGPQVVQTGLVLDRAEVGLEHHVEVARLGPLPAGAAVRTGDLFQAASACGPSAPRELLLEVVGPEPPVAATSTRSAGR